MHFQPFRLFSSLSSRHHLIVSATLALAAGCAADVVDTPVCEDGKCDEQDSDCKSSTHPHTVIVGTIEGPRDTLLFDSEVSMTTGCGTFRRSAERGTFTLPVIWTPEEATKNGTRFDGVFEVTNDGNSFFIEQTLYDLDDMRLRLVPTYESLCQEASYTYRACSIDEPAQFADQCELDSSLAQSVLSRDCGEIEFGPDYADAYGRECPFLGCPDGLVCRPTRIPNSPNKSEDEYCLPPGHYGAGCSEDSDCEESRTCVGDLFCS